MSKFNSPSKRQRQLLLEQTAAPITILDPQAPPDIEYITNIIILMPQTLHNRRWAANWFIKNYVNKGKCTSNILEVADLTDIKSWEELKMCVYIIDENHRRCSIGGSNKRIYAHILTRYIAGLEILTSWGGPESMECSHQCEAHNERISIELKKDIKACYCINPAHTLLERHDTNLSRRHCATRFQTLSKYHRHY